MLFDPDVGGSPGWDCWLWARGRHLIFHDCGRVWEPLTTLARSHRKEKNKIPHPVMNVYLELRFIFSNASLSYWHCLVDI